MNARRDFDHVTPRPEGSKSSGYRLEALNDYVLLASHYAGNELALSYVFDFVGRTVCMSNRYVGGQRVMTFDEFDPESLHFHHGALARLGGHPPPLPSRMAPTSERMEPALLRKSPSP